MIGDDLTPEERQAFLDVCVLLKNQRTEAFQEKFKNSESLSAGLVPDAASAMKKLSPLLADMIEGDDQHLCLREMQTPKCMGFPMSGSTIAEYMLGIGETVKANR